MGARRHRDQALLGHFLECLIRRRAVTFEDQRQVGAPAAHHRQRIGLRRGQDLDLQQRMLECQRVQRGAPWHGAQQFGHERQRQRRFQAAVQRQRMHVQALQSLGQ